MSENSDGEVDHQSPMLGCDLDAAPSSPMAVEDIVVSGLVCPGCRRITHPVIVRVIVSNHIIICL